MKQFVRSHQIAERYGVTVETVRAWARRGWIPCLRAGRRLLLFDPVEVDRALKQHIHRELRRG